MSGLPTPGSTARTRVRRLPDKAVTDRDTAYSILDSGLVAHVAVVTGGQPYVVPVGYARIADEVVFHGSSASRLFTTLATGAPTCLTVTLLDGMVLARSLFESSMHYRTVMALGSCRLLEGDEEVRALLELSEQLMPGRTTEARHPAPQELKATITLTGYEAENTVDAGLASIEHLDYAFKAGSKDEAQIAADFGAGRIDRAEANRRLDASFDHDTAMHAYRDFAKRGVFVTPTLNGGRILDFLDQDDHANDPYLAYIGPGLRATYQWRVDRAAKATPAQIEARHAQYHQVASVLPMLQEAGVTIIAGTDAGFLNSYNFPGIALHQELQLFVKEGLSAPQALSAATRSGPAWFGQMDRYGGVASGKAADLVLLTANPLQDIAATEKIDSVILRGTVYDRAALDKMLADTKAKVAAWNAEAAKAK